MTRTWSAQQEAIFTWFEKGTVPSFNGFGEAPKEERQMATVKQQVLAKARELLIEQALRLAENEGDEDAEAELEFRARAFARAYIEEREEDARAEMARIAAKEVRS